MREENKYRVWVPIAGPDDYDWVKSYDWRLSLSQHPIPKIVPVSAFPRAELRELMEACELNMLVEVPTKVAKRSGSQLWLAKVIRIAGYRVLLRFLGAEAGDDRDFWVGLLCADVHGVGYAARNGLPLVPPVFLSKKERAAIVASGEDEERYWASNFLQILAGTKSIPFEWEDIARQALQPAAHGFRLGLRLEFLDRTYLHHVRVGLVAEVVGPRIRIKFSTNDLEGHHRAKENLMSDDYWVHVSSTQIFPVGWALEHEVELKANEAYRRHCAKILREGPTAFAANDARPEMFHYHPLSDFVSEDGLEGGRGWEVGQRLEALDIVGHGNIHVASVCKLLPGPWLLIQIDEEPADDLLIFHRRSPYLFPVGFCERHGVPLKPPEHMGIQNFVWDEYLAQVDAEAAPAHLFDADDTRYDSSAFAESGLLEAVEVKSGGAELSPAFVLKRIGSRLIHIDFLRHDGDSFGLEFQAFHDFRSPELRPLGWAELIGHPLWHPNPSIGDLRRVSPETLASVHIGAA